MSSCRGITAANKFAYFARAMGIEPKQPPGRAEIKRPEKSLDGQMLFMQFYATSRMMHTATKANFAAVKKFLNQQNYWKWSEKKEPKYE